MVVTSYWQSLELLQVELDRETADFYYVDTPSGRKSLRWRGEEAVFCLTASEIPAWSLSALWNIIHGLDKTYEYPTALTAAEVMESIIATIIHRFHENRERETLLFNLL